jgi:propionate catabolism operon transcriptional regulator
LIESNADVSPRIECERQIISGPNAMNELALAYSRGSKGDRIDVIRQALELAGGEVNKVAEGLGISRSTVWRLGKSV